MKICVYCGSECQDDAKFCTSCGASEFKNKCPNCKNVFVGGFCPNCGTRAGKKARFCPNCGTEYYTNACPNCGYNQANQWAKGAVPPQKIVVVNNVPGSKQPVTKAAPGDPRKACDKWVAFLLCFFFGFFGVHKFYENKVGMGILYLFTGGIFGIGWFADVIAILLKPNPYYVK